MPVPEGKALELFLAKLVSSIYDTMHVGGVADFLPCTMAYVAEAKIPTMLGISIGLKQCRTECKAKPEGDQIQTRAQT